ncbi:MAG: hemolysin family protein [Lysobacteraceae bacterium]
MRILIVFILVVINGFFAMSEMAVMTSRRSRLRQMAQTSKGAARALVLSEHPEKFLSSVQLWITILSLLTGYFGGESVGNELEGPIAKIPMLAPYAHYIALFTGFLIMVLLYGVIGELVPKRIATLFPERLASHVAYPMELMATIVKPGVIAMSALTRMLLRLFRLRKVDGENVTEEEIRLLVAESHEQGVIDKDERNMMNRVLRLGDRTADSMMTPRNRIAWLDAEANLDDNLSVMNATPFSRYPVLRGSDREVLGVLEMKALAARMADHANGYEGSRDLLRDLRPAVFVSESTRALGLLEVFRDEQQSLALVVDEYGDIQGMVTLNDLMGAVIGRMLTSESVDDDLPVVQRADGSWLVDGSLPTDDLLELLAVDSLPDYAEHEYNTLAGMVIARFGRIPHVGEHFDWSNWRFEVVDLDGARIDKLLIAPLAQDNATVSAA